MAQSIDQSAKESYLKVVFSHDVTNLNFQEKYTDKPEGLPGGFAATPAMKVTIPKNTAGLEKKVCVIELPLDTFMLRLTDMKTHAPVFCVVQEVIVPSDPADNTVVLTPFRGRLMKAKRNPAGKTGIVRLELQRPKSRLQIQTGLPVMHHDPFEVYGAGSQLLRVNFRFSLGVSTIVGNLITTGSDPSQAAGFFKNGHAEFEGATLKIREWDGTTGFSMIERPPATWLSQTVDFYAGSNKTIEDVRDKLGNEGNAGMIGYKIPAYNPQFEDTPGD